MPIISSAFFDSLRPQRFVLGIIFLLAFPLQTIGQKSYEGPFSRGNYSGFAEYQFQIIEGDTIFDGSFLFKEFDFDSLLLAQDTFHSFAGNFRTGRPYGSWNFQFGNFTKGDEIQVNNLNYDVRVNGLYHNAYGELINGMPQGYWTHEVYYLKNSERKDLLFKSSINFDQGIPQQSFQVKDDQATLLGRFLRNGLAHDTWELYSQETADIIEKWIFDEGMLTSIVLLSRPKPDTLRIFSEDNNSIKEVTLDEQYIRTINLTKDILGSSNEIQEDIIIKLLRQNASYYEKVRDVLMTLGSSNFAPEYKVQVPYQPLSDQEKVLIDSIKLNYQSSFLIAQRILQNTQYQILQLTDPEVDFLLNAVENHFQKEFLTPLASLVVNEDLMEFLPREKLINIFPDHNMAKYTYTSELDSIKRSIDGIDFNQFQNGGLISIYDISRYANETLDSVQKRLRIKLAAELKREELLGLEKDLIQEVQKFNKKIDSLINVPVASHKKELKRIKDQMTSKLQNYTKISEAEQKIQQAEDLTGCFADAWKLAVQIDSLDERRRILEARYQEDVFNPFTSTIMTEEVKKRITSAYFNILVPYLLQKSQNDLSCEELPELTLLFKSAYQRMLDLKEEDTSKLERKLKGEDDPVEIIELFNLYDIVRQ